MKKKFKIVIWGLGTNGENLIDVLGEENVAAVIESNQDKVKRGYYSSIPIINFDTYREKYSNYFIVVSPMKYMEIERILIENNIKKYFIWNKSDIRMSAFLDINAGTFIDKFEVKEDKKYFICGANLFSIYLYRYLLNNGFMVEFITFTEKNETALNLFLQEGMIQKYYEKDALDDENICLIMTENNSEYIRNDIEIISCEMLNASLYLAWEKDIKKFKDKHKGERVFLVATGPSIRVEDLEKLAYHHEKTMSVNWVFYIFEKTDWRPDYYVLSDGDAIREYENLENTKEMFAGIEKIFSDNYLKFWENDLDDTYHGFRQEQNVNQQLFSSDCSKIIYSGSTVMYTCMQLAVYMGFREIFLLGCDFSFSENFDSPDDHFYGIVQDTYRFDYEFVKKGYEKAREYADAHGIKIFNATRGGKLEVFERVNFDSLF